MASEAERREAALADYRKKLLKHKEADSKVRSLRESVKELKKDYDKTEDDLKALQSVGQIIGEVLRQLDDERCKAGQDRTDERDALHAMQRKGMRYMQRFVCTPCRAGFASSESWARRGARLHMVQADCQQGVPTAGG